MKRDSTQKGIGMIEVVVGAAIFSVILGTLVTASNWYLSGAGESIQTLKAAYFAEEAVEAIKIVRDNGWSQVSSLSTTTNLYLTFAPISGQIVPQVTAIATSTDGFLRTIRLFDVRRDAQGRIVASGGTIDPQTKRIDVTVAWKNKTATTTKILSTYITQLQ